MLSLLVLNSRLLFCYDCLDLGMAALLQNCISIMAGGGILFMSASHILSAFCSNQNALSIHYNVTTILGALLFAIFQLCFHCGLLFEYRALKGVVFWINLIFFPLVVS